MTIFSSDIESHSEHSPVSLHLSSTTTIGHFTVMDGSDGDSDLVLIQTFLLYYVNQVILISVQRESCPIAQGWWILLSG